MQKPQTRTTSLVLIFCLMSALVACGSLANCFNSGLAPAACGGGYSESDVSAMPPPAATSAEGRWTGVTAKGRTVDGVVLDNGSYWVFYTARDNSNVLAGLVQGTGTSHLGSFTSSNTRDFNLEGAGILAATISGSYVQKNRFDGTIAYLNGTMGSIATVYDADYELAPNVDLVAGNYSGLRADNQTVNVTLDTARTVSGRFTDGCTFAGSFSPRANGNVFAITVTFGGGLCSNGTDTVNGIAFYDSATHQLYSAGLNGTRTNGFLFLGTKQ